MNRERKILAQDKVASYDPIWSALREQAEQLATAKVDRRRIGAHYRLCDQAQIC